MRHQATLFLIIYFLLFFRDVSGENTTSLLDELAARYEKAALLNDMELELAALEPYLEEAIRQNNVREEQYARVSKVYCYYNFDAFDLLYDEIDHQMAYFKSRGWWDKYYICANVRVEALMFQNKPASALRESDRLYTEARKANLPNALVMAAYNLFCCYHYSGREEEAARIFEEDILKHKEYIPLGAESDYFTVYSDVLVSLKRYDDLLKHAVAYEQMLIEDEKERIREKIIYDNSGQLLYAFHTYAEAYLGLGLLDKAEYYYEKAITISRKLPNNLVGLYELHARILRAKGDNEGAMIEINKALNNNGAIDNKALRNNQFLLKAELLYDIKHFSEAASIFRQVIEQKDSLTNFEQSIQLDDLRSLYELDRLTKEKEEASARLLIALIVCGAMVITVTLSVFYSRRLKMKNQRLVDHIQEQARLEKERRGMQTVRLAVTAPAMTVASTPVVTEPELFTRLRELLMNERVHLTSEFNRDVLLDRLGTNKNKLNEVVFAVTGRNLMEYVTELRLQEALLLMESQPNLPFNQIAEQTGFGVYSSFYRAFNKQYGVKPTDYKEYRKK